MIICNVTVISTKIDDDFELDRWISTTFTVFRTFTINTTWQIVASTVAS